MEKEEVQHFIQVLHATHTSISAEDATNLKDLSNQTVHSASIYQDSGSIAIAVIVYTLSKLIERKENLQVKNWQKFVKRIDSFLSLAEKALKQGNIEAYESHLESARKSMTLLSVNLKPYIQEVMRKASINKASKIYDHGISMEKTSQLLGITQWELAEYTGQTNTPDTAFNITLDQKRRAKMALDFFS